MRVHRLVLQAVGPFPDRHEIDVDRLSAGGLFLLEGPTGAGKSTIIDAVVFALYGTIDASEDRLPSAHAGPDVEPFVELTFATGAGIHRVRRTPRYARPKRRGGGVTTQNATAKLWRLASLEDAGGEPVAATTQEVGAEIGRIVGLSRSQFTQTVVLPQGRFAAFLRAKPEERRGVLQDVFGTEVYEQLQLRLVEQAKETRAGLGRAAEEVRSGTAAFAHAAGLDDARRADLEAAAEALDAGVLDRASRGVCEEATERSDVASAAEGRARESERAAQERLDAERDLAARLARRAALLAERDELAGGQDEIDATGARLAAAARAARTASALRGADAAARAARSAAEALALRVAEVGAGEHADLVALVPVDPARAGREHLLALRAAGHEATAERGGLTDVLDLEAGLAQRTSRLEEDRAACEREREHVAARAQAVERRPAERAALLARTDAARARAAGLSGATAAHERAEEVLVAARACEERRAEHLRARERMGRAIVAARKAQQAEHETRMRWIAGLAGELAGQLEDDQACPVCGSLDHPEPAAAAADHPSTEDVDAATAVRRAAEAELATARTAEATLGERVAALAAAAGERDVATAAAERDAATVALLDARAAGDELVALERDIAGFDTATAELDATLTHACSALAGREATHRAAVDQLERDRGHCDRARGASPSVAARAADLARRVAAADRLADVLERHLDAARTAATAAGTLAEALAECGFADAATAREARLDGAVAAELERRVNEHATSLARVDAGLAEQSIAALTGDELADVPAAREAHTKAQAALTGATRAAVQARECAARSASARTQLVDALDRHASRAQAAAPVLRMAALATAGEGNASATTLATFVLLRRFEDVVAAANERLAAMSDGRYSLERIDEREGGQRARKAGLGLQVRDHVTERARDPYTLSGGETFYVSLALALGLADVVTSESGGIALDTLFVDEGFGSLDPDTLDDVLAELSRLQAGGRAVGIVSHVTELKSRIAERIEVRRLPSGASTLAVVC